MSYNNYCEVVGLTDWLVYVHIRGNGENSDLRRDVSFELYLKLFKVLDAGRKCDVWSLARCPVAQVSQSSVSFLPFQANEDVTQIVEILHSGPSKWNWLTRRLVEFTSSGSVLLFVTKKANAEELANNLKQEGHNLGLLHGDMDQSERNKVISDFKKKDIPVLVATDVAGKV